MKIVNSIGELSKIINQQKHSHQKIGFVPTMGYLHQGHVSLVEKSLNDGCYTVVSIFVNPTQFNNASDLDNYPSSLDADIKKLKLANCDLLFLPTKEEMYPEGDKLISFNLEGIDKPLEGEFRSGHFEGVVTIVSKFFELIKPNYAYFGEKDYQQLLVIKQLAKKMFPNIAIVAGQIVREPNGLAMSSRNARLSETEREIASKIYNTMQAMNTQRDLTVKKLEEYGSLLLEKIPEIELEYLRVVDAKTLLPATEHTLSQRVFIAAHIGEVRLIDNMELRA